MDTSMNPDKSIQYFSDTVEITYKGDQVGNCGLTFDQLWALYEALHSLNIGPKVIDINDISFRQPTLHTLILERVDLVMDPYGINPELLRWFDAQGITDYKQFLQQKLKEVVDILRNDLGYAHGDLHEYNVGYRLQDNNFQLVLLDLDNAFPIKLGRYINDVKDFINKYDYDDFVQRDYTYALERLL